MKQEREDRTEMVRQYCDASNRNHGYDVRAEPMVGQVTLSSSFSRNNRKRSYLLLLVMVKGAAMPAHLLVLLSRDAFVLLIEIRGFCDIDNIENRGSM